MEEVSATESRGARPCRRGTRAIVSAPRANFCVLHLLHDRRAPRESKGRPQTGALPQDAGLLQDRHPLREKTRSNGSRFRIRHDHAGAVFSGAGRESHACMIHFDGLDVMKEWIYLAGIAQELQRRGIATLIVDHPGVGEALRLRDLPSIPEMEKPAATPLLTGWQRARKSMRSASASWRFRSAAITRRAPPPSSCASNAVSRGARDGTARTHRHASARSECNRARSVPHFVDHLHWVFGQSNHDDSTKIIDA